MFRSSNSGLATGRLHEGAIAAIVWGMTEPEPPATAPFPAADPSPSAPPPFTPDPAANPAPSRNDRLALTALLGVLAMVVLALFALRALKNQPTATAADPAPEEPVTLALPETRADQRPAAPEPLAKIDNAGDAPDALAASPHATPATAPTNAIADAGGDLKSAAKEAAKTLGGLHSAPGGADAFAATSNDLSKIANQGGEGLGAFARAAAALRALETAASSGAPFARELDLYRAADPDGDAAEALRPWADKGLPTPAALLERLGDARRSALAAEAPLGLAVSVRGENAGGTAALFDAAEERLGAGDAAGAAAALSALSPAAAEQAAVFLADLKASEAATSILKTAADRLYGPG